MAVHPLDRVGVDVGGRHLDGRRQVEDRLAFGGRLPHRVDRVADVDGELQLGAGVRLRRVLERDVGVAHPLRELRADPGTLDGDVADAVAVEPEDHPALQRRGGVVQVHDGLLGPAYGVERPLDQLLTRLREHLDGHVVGDDAVLDDLPDEVEVGLAGGRETDLDLLVAHPHQQLEEPALALRAHRVDQGLVAVAQVDRAPARRLGDGPVRPRAVGEPDRGERAVALVRHGAGLLGVLLGMLGMNGHEGSSADRAVRRPAQRDLRGEDPAWSGLAAARKEQLHGPHRHHPNPPAGKSFDVPGACVSAARHGYDAGGDRSWSRWSTRPRSTTTGEELADLQNAASVVDSPQLPRSGRDTCSCGSPRLGGLPVVHVLLLARKPGGELVGSVEIDVAHWDNPELWPSSTCRCTLPIAPTTPSPRSCCDRPWTRYAPAAAPTSSARPGSRAGWPASGSDRAGRSPPRRPAADHGRRSRPHPLDAQLAAAEQASTAYDIEVLPWPTPGP